MAQVSGVDIVAAVYEETTFGADPSPTPSGTKIFFSSLNVTASQNIVESPIITGGRGVSRPGRGNINVSGDLVTNLAPGTCDFWLKQILGTPTGAGTNGDPYIYVPKALPTSFLIEKDYTDKIASKVERFNGCRVASATFTLNQEGFADLSVSILGKSYSVNAAVLDASLTEPTHSAWTGFQGIVKLDGSQIGGVLGGTLTVDNEMDGDLYAFPASGETAGERFSLPEGRARISGQMELVFEDFSLVDIAQAGTEIDLEWIYTDGSGNILSILIDHAEIPLTSPAIETRSGLRVTYPFSAFASGSDMGLKITNTPPA